MNAYLYSHFFDSDETLLPGNIIPYRFILSQDMEEYPLKTLISSNPLPVLSYQALNDLFHYFRYIFISVKATNCYSIV